METVARSMNIKAKPLAPDCLEYMEDRLYPRLFLLIIVHLKINAILKALIRGFQAILWPSALTNCPDSLYA